VTGRSQGGGEKKTTWKRKKKKKKPGGGGGEGGLFGTAPHIMWGAKEKRREKRSKEEDRAGTASHVKARAEIASSHRLVESQLVGQKQRERRVKSGFNKEGGNKKKKKKTNGRVFHITLHRFSQGLGNQKCPSEGKEGTQEERRERQELSKSAKN